MPAPKTRISDTQFKVYVGTAALEKFRLACDDLGINYSEACRRLIATFNDADPATRSRLTRKEEGVAALELRNAVETPRTTGDADLKPTPLLRAKTPKRSQRRAAGDSKS